MMPEAETCAATCCRSSTSRVFRGNGEFGVSAGLRGGAGRTRTGNHPVISPSRQVPNPAPTNTAWKMVAERTGLLLRTER
jgi:hypothetical protein